MFERVVELLSRYTEERQIQPQSSLEADLGLSSFDVVEIVADFEEEFEIEISDRDMGKFTCVNDILEYLENKKYGIREKINKTKFTKPQT